MYLYHLESILPKKSFCTTVWIYQSTNTMYSLGKVVYVYLIRHSQSSDTICRGVVHHSEETGIISIFCGSFNIEMYVISSQCGLIHISEDIAKVFHGIVIKCHIKLIVQVQYTPCRFLYLVFFVGWKNITFRSKSHSLMKL